MNTLRFLLGPALLAVFTGGAFADIPYLTKEENSYLPESEKCIRLRGTSPYFSKDKRMCDLVQKKMEEARKNGKDSYNINVRDYFK